MVTARMSVNRFNGTSTRQIEALKILKGGFEEELHDPYHEYSVTTKITNGCFVLSLEKVPGGFAYVIITVALSLSKSILRGM